MVMMGRAREWAGLRHRSESALRFRRHHVDRLGPFERHSVFQEVGVVGEVAVERASEGDVHHLHPPADAERWHREPIGGVQQRDLELVPVGFDPVEVIVGLGAVA